MGDLHRLDIAGLAAAFAASTTTPSAVTRAYLDRIASLDPKLHAFIDVDEAGAGAGAAQSDARVAGGTARAIEGVPVAIKANIAVAGLPWSAGMALHRDRIAVCDAAVVSRLRAAGAVVLGTLNMHEAALGATTDNRWFGRAFNPHGEGRTPGGSSGGSGAAVAAGLCVAALGTDTMGSVRIPAAYTGVYGLKPTHGALPEDGLEPLSRALDAIGPIARSLDDLAAVWGVLAGDAAPGVAPVLRLLTLDGLGGVACEAAVLAGYERALAALPGPRATLALPPLSSIRVAGFVASARELGAALGGDRHSERLSPELRWLLDYAERGAADPALLAATRAAIVDALDDDGVLLLPTAPQAAFAQATRAPSNQADFTALANVAGLPALSLPAGRDAAAMPLAVQLIGPAGSERALIALARTLDAALDGYAPPPHV